MYENRRRTHGWGARAVNVPARISLWLAVLFILTGMVLFAIEDARPLVMDADARARMQGNAACDSLPAWARKP